MQATQIYSEQRRHPRNPVEWYARVDIGGSAVAGTIRDHSAGGLCFEPEAGYVDGRLQSDETVAEAFERGDMVAVTIHRGYGTKTDRHIAGVRWRGYSDTHDCPAIGLEFLQ